LGLDKLFAHSFANLDQSLVVLIARPRNAKNVLAYRNVRQNYAARAADARFSLVVDVNLGI
jgi:hypothetical protein